MAEIRIRCQVLKVIAAMTDGTADDVSRHLPNLTPQQIQKALYNLCNDDEIRKIGEQSRDQENGKPWNLYRVRDEGVAIDLSKKKFYKKSGRKNYSQEMMRPTVWDSSKNRIVVRYRDRKLKLLNRFLTSVNGTDEDLLIGIINDYKA